MNLAKNIDWTFLGQNHTGLWISERGVPVPAKIECVDDTLTADSAYRKACEGSYLLWQGDYHNARQLLSAMGRRSDTRKKKAKPAGQTDLPANEVFNKHRMAQAQRASILHRLLVPIDEQLQVALKRAPDTSEALHECLGLAPGSQYLISLKELLGILGAYQWMIKGVTVPALGADKLIHPAYGVFSPVRGEYLDLIAKAPLPAECHNAFDIGAGTGVVAAILAARGIPKVTATEVDSRALVCARSNISRLGLASSVSVLDQNMFPEGKAELVVCNPPWLPAKPSSPIEAAIYDYNSQMLKAFLAGLAHHLEPKGEGWLILSNLAELLQLRSRQELEQWIADAKLKVLGKLDTKPVHAKASRVDDPLHVYRQREVTSLWRLGHA